MYRKVEESQTLLINTQSKILASHNKKIIKFGFGQSPFLPPTNVLQALEKAIRHKEYSSVQGDLELRQLMSKFHKKHNGLDVNPDDILIAPGSKILIYTILLAFEKADVFIPAPAWVSYAPQSKLAGHNIIKLNTSFQERWRINSDTINKSILEKQHGPSILILNYPGNPDGLTYNETELIDIAKTAKENNFLVISDEIYGLLNHSITHLSFANYYPENTITTTGLSKCCGAGGWRLGAALLSKGISPEFKQVLIGIGSETYSCAPTPVQIAARAAYNDYDESKLFLSYQIDILSQIGKFCATKLNDVNVKVYEPQGGFYLFPDFSYHKEKLYQLGIRTSNQLCEKLLQNYGVALLPASAFGFNEDYLAVRLAYVDFEEPNSDKDFDLDKDFPNIIEGIDFICQFIENL